MALHFSLNFSNLFCLTLIFTILALSQLLGHFEATRVSKEDMKLISKKFHGYFKFYFENTDFKKVVRNFVFGIFYDQKTVQNVIVSVIYSQKTYNVLETSLSDSISVSVLFLFTVGSLRIEALFLRV